MNTMFLYSSNILAFIFIIELSYAIDLRHDFSDTKPIIFKILERNNKIVVERDDNGVEGLDVDYLKKLLNQNADLVYDVNNIIKANKPTNRGDKRKLVKRIIPHGVEMSNDLQFYKNVGTMYRPLLTLHKTKKLASSPVGSASPEDTVISFRNADAIPKLDIVQNQLERMRNYSSDLQRMKTKEFVVKHPFSDVLHQRERKHSRQAVHPANPAKLATETEHTMQHLSEMERLASITQDPLLKGVLRSKLSTLREQTEQVHSSILEMLSADQIYGDSVPLKKTSIARNRAVDDESSSDEAITQQPVIHVAPGVSATLPPNAKPQQLQCALFPHQPLWNFWHYQQQIIEERCPEGTLIGDVCGRLPPHK